MTPAARFLIRRFERNFKGDSSPLKRVCRCAGDWDNGTLDGAFSLSVDGTASYVHNCGSVLAYIGWMEQSDSYHLYQTRVKPYVKKSYLEGVISRESK